MKKWLTNSQFKLREESVLFANLVKQTEMLTKPLTKAP